MAYKSARQLRIPVIVYNGLIEFVDLAESGGIAFIPEVNTEEEESHHPTAFNMTVVRCGAAACIKGWIPSLVCKTALEVQKEVDKFCREIPSGSVYWKFNRTTWISDLMYPTTYPKGNREGVDPYSAGPRWAAATTRRYLETGKVDWQGCYCEG